MAARQVLLAMLISVVASARQFNVFASITRISAERVALSDDRGHDIELLRRALKLPVFATATKARIEAIVSILHDSRKLNRRPAPFSGDRRD